MPGIRHYKAFFRQHKSRMESWDKAEWSEEVQAYDAADALTQICVKYGLTLQITPGTGPQRYYSQTLYHWMQLVSIEPLNPPAIAGGTDRSLP